MATENENTKLISPTDVGQGVTDTARPICVHCGASLFARTHGDMTCVQHGHFFSHDLLDSAFGIGSAEYARQLAEASNQAPVKCPVDRYAMSHVASPTGRVHAQACARCGSLWIDLAVIEQVMATTPATDASPAERRSVIAFACARGVLTPASKVPRTR